MTTPRRASFTLVDSVVKPGTSKQIDIPVARLPPGDWARMDVVVLHGRTPGPTIWLSGAIHGDELNGIEIVRRVLTLLDPKKLSGTVIAVPIVNLFGVTSGSRYLPDRRDLNRSFPGSARGSLAGRLAHLFFDTVVSRCSTGLDFHTGSAGRFNLPQIRCDLDDPETAQMAAAFRPPVVMHATLRDGSLRSAARKAGARVLLYEGGEAHRFDEDAIEFGARGTLRVLESLGMLPEGIATPSDVETETARKTTWLRASHSGFHHPAVTLGERVSSGQIVARIKGSVGNAKYAIRSRVNGTVISVQKTAVVYRGDAIIHVAETPGAGVA